MCVYVFRNRSGGKRTVLDKFCEWAETVKEEQDALVYLACHGILLLPLLVEV